VTAAELIRETRRRHNVSQASLARRSRTSQTHISRIERGESSPSVATLERILAVLGERLELGAEPGRVGNQSATELRAEMALTHGERVAQAAALSSALTAIASGARKR
jgi:transcriptional regulator with XRE-family HTH domain